MNGVSMVAARYVLYFKSDEDKEEWKNERYVSGVHLVLMLGYLVLWAQTIRYISVRIILVGAMIKGFRIWVVSVKFVYLQLYEPFVSNRFITIAASEFELSPEELLELFKSICSLADSGHEWHRILNNDIHPTRRCPLQ